MSRAGGEALLGGIDGGERGNTYRWQGIADLPRRRVGHVLGALSLVAFGAALLLPVMRNSEVAQDDESLANVSTKSCLVVAACLAVWLMMLMDMVRGPMDKRLSGILPVRRNQVRYGGQVEPGYEEVERVFRSHFDQGVEGGAQCCAYVRGGKVVDLWGQREGGVIGVRDYTDSTLQNVFSSTKTVTSLVVAMLADRGHLRYDMRIADIWPEFSQNGKGEITVAELMRHEGGMPTFDGPVNLDEANAAGVKAGKLSALIAGQTPKWPDHRREYHALTRGWIANEIVVRVDPSHRTIGEFLRDEIAAPLELSADFFIGTPEAELQRAVDLTGGMANMWTAIQSFLPSQFRIVAVPAFLLWVPIYLGLLTITSVRCACRRAPKAELTPEFTNSYGCIGCITKASNGPADQFNHPTTRKSECPSANGHANAHAMAKIMAVISQGGTAFGVTLLSPEGLQSALADPVIAKTFVTKTTSFTNCGWNMYEGYPNTLSDRTGYIGWMGLGGSAMHFHPRFGGTVCFHIIRKLSTTHD